MSRSKSKPTGRSSSSGQYPYVANMTVETAVAIAGGFTPRGYHRTMTISRNFPGGTYRFEVPITYPICPGDTVQVQERWF
jgi:polysaccharide export outer membrane protein